MLKRMVEMVEKIDAWGETLTPGRYIVIILVFSFTIMAVALLIGGDFK